MKNLKITTKPGKDGATTYRIEFHKDLVAVDGKTSILINLYDNNFIWFNKSQIYTSEYSNNLAVVYNTSKTNFTTLCQFNEATGYYDKNAVKLEDANLYKLFDQLINAGNKKSNVKLPF